MLSIYLEIYLSNADDKQGRNMHVRMLRSNGNPCSYMYIVFVPCLSFEGLAMEQSVGSSSLSLDGNDISAFGIFFQ